VSQPAQANDTDWLVQVRPGARRNFYDGYETGCPALTARCRRAGYVVAGDQLVASLQKGVFTYVIFINRVGKASTGWVETVALARITPPPPTNAAWIGSWSRTEASIEIKPAARRGWFEVGGWASWGGSDPDRVARGAVNIGEMEGEIALSDGRLTAATGDVVRHLPPENPDDFDCRVQLRLLGPYLIAEDNNQCGGVNVSFSGVYRK